MSKPKASERYLKTGHAPGHIRECLLESLDHGEDWWQHLEMDFLRDRHQRWWDGATPLKRAYWLLGQLWHCTDIVGSQTLSEVQDWLLPDDPNANLGTYAKLARALKADLDAAQVAK
jgi:hypothetical protein